MATIPRTAKSRQSLEHGQLGLFGVIMPGVAQVAPGVQPLFHHRADSKPGRRLGAADLPDFNGGHGGHGEQPGAIRQHLPERRVVHHLHHPRHRHQVAVAVGVITILGYIIAFGGIYIFVGSYIVQNDSAIPMSGG